MILNCNVDLNLKFSITVRIQKSREHKRPKLDFPYPLPQTMSTGTLWNVSTAPYCPGLIALFFKNNL